MLLDAGISAKSEGDEYIKFNLSTTEFDEHKEPIIEVLRRAEKDSRS